MSSRSRPTQTTEENLASAEKALEDARTNYPDRPDKIDGAEDRVLDLQKRLQKEQEDIKPHPALQFGPIAQTVAAMSAISLSMSVVNLPYQMKPFYNLFSRLTIITVLCFVVYTSIIWYGYQEAVKVTKKKEESLEKKLAKMMKARADRPDRWAHTRSHPSAFLTTKLAPPRMFPFPLGKSRPEATVKDELWWEGGNAPHVGHFNKPKIAEPTPPDEQTLMERVKKSMAIEDQQNLWHKRIRKIQALCLLIIVAFINKKIAIAGLCWLIYWTFHSEIENMLKPPTDFSEIYHHIDMLQQASGRNETAPKPGKDQPVGGMSYIYDQNLKPEGNIPIVVVPPHVLMTSENRYYAGPGEQIKEPK